MYVDIDLAPIPASVVLREADDLRSLKVLVRHPDDGRRGLEEALAEIGWLDPSGDAFLRIDALKRLAGHRASSADWVASFDEMVEFASSHGWVDAGGAALQAHCEWDVDDAAAI